MAAGIYQQLLGAEWDRLDDLVRTRHCCGGTVRGSGCFEVRHGRGLPARILARLLRLPAEGTDVMVELVVSPREDREEWSRRFGISPFVTMQWVGDRGLLMERSGPLEIGYELRVADGALHYRSMQAGIRCGSHTVAVPRAVAPQIVALESPDPHGEGTLVSVDVRLPALGLLIGYRGTLFLDGDVG